MDMINRLGAGVMIVLTTLFLGSQAFGGELAPHVLAQVDESGGFRTTIHRAIRIFDDGKIEKLDAEKWVEIGRLSKPTVLRLKQVTDVMTPKNKLYTEDSGMADGPTIVYLVKNKEGEVVLIGKKGAQNSILLQGGVSSIMLTLDGLKALAWISY